jgi:hypothetical protein
MLRPALGLLVKMAQALLQLETALPGTRYTLATACAEGPDRLSVLFAAESTSTTCRDAVVSRRNPRER